MKYQIRNITSNILISIKIILKINFEKKCKLTIKTILNRLKSILKFQKF